MRPIRNSEYIIKPSADATPPLRTARCRHPIAPPRRVERKTPLAVSRTSRRPFLALVSGAGHPASAVLPRRLARSPRTQLAMCSSRLSAATPIAGERAHLPLPSHPPSSTPATAGAVAKCAAGLLCAFHRLRVPPLIGHHTTTHHTTHTHTHTHTSHRIRTVNIATTRHPSARTKHVVLTCSRGAPGAPCPTKRAQANIPI